MNKYIKTEEHLSKLQKEFEMWQKLMNSDDEDIRMNMSLKTHCDMSSCDETKLRPELVKWWGGEDGKIEEDGFLAYSYDMMDEVWEKVERYDGPIRINKYGVRMFEVELLGRNCQVFFTSKRFNSDTDSFHKDIQYHLSIDVETSVEVPAEQCRPQEGDCCLCEGRYEWFGNNADPLADGICCNKCNDKVIDARLGFKLGDCPTTTGYMRIAKRNGNEFIFNNGNSKFIAHYNEDGFLKSAEFWDRDEKRKTPKGAILVHKIDDEDSFPYVKLVEKNYELIGDEAIVCDYDRDW